MSRFEQQSRRAESSIATMLVPAANERWIGAGARKACGDGSARDAEPAVAIARLVDLGFEVCLSGRVTRTLLDTFDGRLHRSGLRLEAREADRVELILSGEGTASAHIGVSSLPRWPADIARGPFRSRIADVIDVRALMPLVAVTAARTVLVRRQSAGKTVSTATVYDELRVVGDNDLDPGRWAVEVEELTGYPKQARTTCASLEELGLTRLGGDALDMAASVAGIDLAGYSDSPTVPLDARLPAIEGLRLVLANLADTIDANWEPTIDRRDPEFLHDLRVAGRRTRTVVSQGKKVLPPALTNEASHRFAGLGALTGPARDLDVYLTQWDSYTSALAPAVVASVEPLRELLEQRRAEAHVTMTAGLRSPDIVEFMASWRTWLTDPGHDVTGESAAAPRLGTFVAERITKAQTVLVERGRRIGPDSPVEQVHDLRKDAKKLRYLLECFASTIPDRARRSFVNRLKSFQDLLGEHQDADIHARQLRALAVDLNNSDVGPNTMLGVGQLIEQLDQRRIAARASFATGFSDYDNKATQRSLEAAVAHLRPR